MFMLLDALSPDITVQEYECVEPPKEIHIREDQVGLLLHDSFVRSIATDPILTSKKELSTEEFEVEQKIFAEYIASYGRYHFSLFLGETDRLYNAYCWQRYKEKKKVIVEPSYFEKAIREWIYGEDESEEEKDETKFEQETKEGHEDENTHTSNNLHVFDEKQMNIRLKMYKEAVYARYAEYYYEHHLELPEPEFVMENVKEKLNRECNIIERFAEAGRKCQELSSRLVLDDFQVSFDDGYFIFTYGKSIYKFTVTHDAFYLKGKKVDMCLFFNNLRNENKRVWKHSIRLAKLFEKRGIPYHFSRYENMFILYRIVDEEDDVFYLRYKNAECRLRWDKRKFYRLNGEEVKNPAILVHEMIELDGNRKKAQLKAKQYFQTFLTKEEKEMFIKTKSVLIEGKNYYYIFCPDILANSIIRIEKETEKVHSMCVMLEDPYIPRYDVIASALLMVKTGQEKQLNAIANAFGCSEEHRKMLKKHGFL